jgi:hypothetical protein
MRRSGLDSDSIATLLKVKIAAAPMIFRPVLANEPIAIFR